METLLQDVRYGFRMLRKNPGFTAVAVIALGLGIGANTAIFSVVNAVLLRPLPYKHPEQLVVLLHDDRNPVAPGNFVDWQRQNHVFEAMGAAEYWTPNLTGNENAEKMWALQITPDVLPMLGVQPLLGRVFLPEEQESGKNHEVVLSYQIWQSNFAGDQRVLGRSMTLDGDSYTIVGAMPRDFKFAPFWATKAGLWAPLTLGDRANNRTSNSLRIFARLKSGVTLQAARAEMATITGRLEQQYPGTNRNLTVTPLKEKVVGNIRPALLVLLVAVGFVLLIACANVAHMLLARAAARQKEIAVRSALGARRSRMVRQFLTESLALALLGGVAGLLLAQLGIHALVALSPADIPRVETVGLDGSVLGFALAISVLTGVIFGLAPALHASSINLSDSLKEGERGSSEGIQRNRLRSVLVASEFGFAMVLLIGAGLMIRSFLALQAVDPGFNPHNVLSMVVSVTGTKEAGADRRALFFQQMLERIQATPGVRSASAINHLPLAGDIWGFPFSVEGRPRPRPGESPSAIYRVVLPGYFRTMNIPMLRGRDISESDNVHAPGVVVVNEFLARRYWPGEDPVGKRITLDDSEKNPSRLTVIGVVKNTFRGDWAEPPQEEFFLPYLQTHSYLEDPSSHFAYLTLVVRTGGDPASLVPTIRSAIASLDINVPVSEVQTMDEVIAESTAEPKFYLLLLGTFATVALILAAVGIYGVMTFSVSRRTHEIGIRMALGAQAADVIKLVVRQGMVLACAGVGAGVLGALALTRMMSGLLYGIRPTDPLTFVLVGLGLSLVAAIASFIPAYRAAKFDPMVALRYE
jgi:predicted permease